jgi:DNA-binding NarL/FixJ family response regulator
VNDRRQIGVAMTRLLVVGEVPDSGSGLVSELTDAGFSDVQRADSAETAVAVADQQLPDVVLFCHPTQRSVLEAIEQITRRVPGTRVVALGAFASDEDKMRGLERGVCGYLAANTPMPALVEALRSVADGGAVLSPHLMGKVLDRWRPLWHEQQPTLTSRELEVLQLVAHGFTSREVGHELFIAENTVKNHVRNILEKLGLHSRRDAVLHAVRENLISLPAS